MGAPAVTKGQAGCLRFARDNGWVDLNTYNANVLYSCQLHEWIRDDGTNSVPTHYTLTFVGRAALAYFDAWSNR